MRFKIHNLYISIFNSKIFNAPNHHDKLYHYFSIHNKILIELNGSNRKIFFCQPEAGYGNRLYGVLSALLLSILVESQFVLDWPSVAPFISPPIRIFDSFDAKIGLSEEQFFKNFHGFPFPRQAWWRVKNLRVLINDPLPIPTNKLRYGYGSGRPLFMEVCAIPSLFNKFQFYNLSRVETLEEARRAIRNNTISEKELQNKVFQVGYEIGGNLLNRVWRPSEIIQKEIDFYVEKYFKVFLKKF